MKLVDRLRQHFDAQTIDLDKPLATERELSRTLGVGRSALRSALAQLEEEGLIWRRQGKGTFLAPTGISFAPSVQRLSARTNFFEVMEARLHIEPVLVRLAALRATTEQIAMIERMAMRTNSHAPDATHHEIEVWDGAFHRSIAESAGNRLLLDIFELVETIRKDESWEAYRAKARTPESSAVAGREHLQIAGAIAARSPKLASEMMREHIRSLHQRLTLVAEDELSESE
jgi:DNA-binding FadR family transcriptional regulator